MKTDTLKLSHHAARRFRPASEAGVLLARIRRKFAERNELPLAPNPKLKTKRQIKQDRLTENENRIKPFSASALIVGTGTKVYTYRFRGTPVLIIRENDLISADRLFCGVTGVSPKDSRVNVSL